MHSDFFLGKGPNNMPDTYLRDLKKIMFSNSKALVHRALATTLFQVVSSLVPCGVGVSHVNMWSFCF